MTADKLTPVLGETWAKALYPMFDEPFMQTLGQRLVKERKNHNVFPSAKDQFRAFRETPMDQVKVVIVGQDPYHTPGLADGLAFSVRDEPLSGYIPPSLQNILIEANDDVGLGPVSSYDLTPWAKQGVLMLNTLLTVREGQPLSHKDIGWRMFTSRVLDSLVESRFFPFVFVGWGAKAQATIDRHIDVFFHPYVRSPHPSPLSAHRGFFGSCPFSRVNEALIKDGIEPIDWTL